MKINDLKSVYFKGASFQKTESAKTSFVPNTVDTSSLDIMNNQGRAFVEMTKSLRNLDGAEFLSCEERIETLDKIGIKDKTKIERCSKLDNASFLKFINYLKSGKSYEEAMIFAKAKDEDIEKLKIVMKPFESLFQSGQDSNNKDLLYMTPETILNEKTFENLFELANYDIAIPKARIFLAEDKNLTKDYIECVNKYPDLNQEDLALAVLSGPKNKNGCIKLLQMGINPFLASNDEQSCKDEKELKYNTLRDMKFYERSLDSCFENAAKMLKAGCDIRLVMKYENVEPDKLDYILELTKDNKKGLENCLKEAYNPDFSKETDEKKWKTKLYFVNYYASESSYYSRQRFLERISQSSDEEVEIYKNFAKEDMPTWQIETIDAKLFKKMPEFLDKGFSYTDSYTLSKMNDAQLKTCFELIQDGIKFSDASILCYRAKEERDTLLPLVKKGFDWKQAESIKYWDKESQNKVIDLMNRGASFNNACNLVLNPSNEDVENKAIKYEKYFYSPDKIAKDEEACKIADYFIENIVTGDDEKDKPVCNFYLSYKENPEAMLQTFDCVKDVGHMKVLMYCIEHGFSKEKTEEIINLVQNGVNLREIELAQGDAPYDSNGKKIENKEDAEALLDLMKNGIKPDVYSIARTAKSLKMPVCELAQYLKGGAQLNAVYDAICNHKDNQDLANFLIWCSENQCYDSYLKKNMLDTKDKIDLTRDFLKRGIFNSNTDDAVYYAQFEYKDDKQKDRLAELYKLGAARLSAYFCSRSEDTYKQKRAELLKYGEDRERYNTHLKNAAFIAKNTDIDFDTVVRIAAIIDSSVLRADDGATLKKIANYAKEKGVDIEYVILLSKFPSKIKKLEKLLSDGVDPKVAQIMTYSNVKEGQNSKIELITKLLYNSPLDEIKNKVKNKNIEENMDYIFSSINKNPEVIKKLLNSGMTYEEIIDGASKFSKNSLKLAMKRPNQYLSGIPIELTTKINGKYPTLQGVELKKYQNLFCEAISQEDVLPEVIKMAHCLDSDTFNQIMDKRLEGFMNTLEKFGDFEKSDRKLISKLISLKTPQGKPLTAKEKIDVIKLVMGLKNAQIPFDELNDLENIDLPKLKRNTLQKTFELVGIGKEEFDKIDDDKLKFDENYVHLLLKSANTYIFKNFWINTVLPMQNSEEEREEKLQELEGMLDNPEILEHDGFNVDVLKEIYELLKNNSEVKKSEIMRLCNMLSANSNDENALNLEMVIKMATLSDFKTEIQDTSNKIGKANHNTKEQFKQNGLNYDIWFNKDEKFDRNVNLNGKDFKITMWERNPQKDLFMGNKTSCCTAMGEVNAASTPIYLLNSAFNVVEMKDDKGNTVAMSRIFMANVDNKPSLIMENVEVNQEFVKYLDNEKQHEVLAEFVSYMKEFSKSVNGNNDTEVYLSTSYSKLNTDNLDKVTKEINFIGDISSENVYLNTATDWVSVDKMQNLSAEFYKV